MVFRVAKQGVLRGILERERVARSVRWCDEEQVVEEPAVRGRVTRSVWWCGKERRLEEPAGHGRAARSV